MAEARYESLVDIPADHAAFAGHFPGQPILPGVLLLKRVMDLAEAGLGRSLAVCALRNVKFIAPVMPRDRLRLELAQTSPVQYSFSVHIVQADVAQAVLACSGQLRP